MTTIITSRITISITIVIVCIMIIILPIMTIVMTIMIHDYDHESGIIERGQRIDTLAMFVEEAEQTLQTMLNQVQAGRARIEQLEMQREIHQKNLNASNQSLGQRRTDHGVQRVKREEAQARRERNRKDHLDVVEQLFRD